MVPLMVSEVIFFRLSNPNFCCSADLSANADMLTDAETPLKGTINL